MPSITSRACDTSPAYCIACDLIPKRLPESSSKCSRARSPHAANLRLGSELAENLAQRARDIGRPLQIADVLSAVPVSRRLLERHFVAAMGRTMLREIHRQQLLRAQNLLVETKLDLERVANASGFVNAKQMGALFQKHLRITPRVTADSTEHGTGSSEHRTPLLRLGCSDKINHETRRRCGVISSESRLETRCRSCFKTAS